MELLCCLLGTNSRYSSRLSAYENSEGTPDVRQVTAGVVFKKDRSSWPCAGKLAKNPEEATT